VGMNATLSTGTVSPLGSASVTLATSALAVPTVSSSPAARMGTARRVLSVVVRRAGPACSALLLCVARSVRGTMECAQGQASASAREGTVERTALSAALSQAASMDSAESHWSAYVRKAGREPSATNRYALHPAVGNMVLATPLESAVARWGTRGTTVRTVWRTQAVLMEGVTSLMTVTASQDGLVKCAISLSSKYLGRE